MIKLLTPENGATVTLLRPNHLDYVHSPHSAPAADVDWLNLREGKEDLSYPLPVDVTYEPSDARVTLRLWREGEREEDALVLEGEEGRAEIWNLLIGTKYFLSASLGEERSQTVSFFTDATAPRMLYVDGISNVRDAGGFSTTDGRRVKQGMLYRTSEMDRHVNITEEGKRAMYALGMRTDLDIRGAGEEPHAVLDTDKVDYVNIPLAAYDAVFTEEQMRHYHETYQLLLRPSAYPLFIHCWGGIDRTGTWLYILGAMLGVSVEDISLDYEMSSFSRWGKRSRTSDQFQGFLRELHMYGENTHDAACAFLRKAGVTDEEMDKIREILLED